jgi:phage shock protein E
MRILAILVATSMFVCAAVSAAEQTGEIIWIDVRTPAEYEQAHFGAATNINFDAIDKHIGEVTEDRNADIRLYCRSGRRSGFAKETLEKMGYRNVSNEGGLLDVLNKYARTRVCEDGATETTGECS